MMPVKTLAAALVLGVASAAQAAVIFTDDFDANATALNAVPSGWSVSDGTVDVIGTSFFDLIPGNGRLIDLDGSTSNAGVLSRSFALTGGQAYEAVFTLAGSRRGDSNTVDFSFGSATGFATLASAAGPTQYALAFTPAADGSFALSFANQGGDNLGALLLDVTVSGDAMAPIPEPQTYALMLAGLAVLGVVARRRRRV